MDILYLMIICSVSLAIVFLLLFIYNAKKGQFEDDESPAVRILLEEDSTEETLEHSSTQGTEKEKSN